MRFGSGDYVYAVWVDRPMGYRYLEGVFLTPAEAKEHAESVRGEYHTDAVIKVEKFPLGASFYSSGGKSIEEVMGGGEEESTFLGIRPETAD